MGTYGQTNPHMNLPALFSEKPILPWAKRMDK